MGNYLKLLACLVVTACCGSINPYLGGSNFRVLDADRIDSFDYQWPLLEAYREVEACLGQQRDFGRIEFYTTSGILARSNTMWRPVLGLTKGRRIYVVRGLPSEISRQVFKHEMAHYITKLGHPEIDEQLVACGIPVTIGTR